MKSQKLKIVCFSCNFGWGYLGDKQALSEKIANWIPIPCIGKIDATDVMGAFKNGADGVLILGCPEGDCHYQDGNLETKKRVYFLYDVLKAYGIEKERLRIKLARDPEGTQIPSIVQEMEERLVKLGPLTKTEVVSG